MIKSKFFYRCNGHKSFFIAKARLEFIYFKDNIKPQYQMEVAL